MFFDILAVFVVSLISSLFICSTSVNGLPLSSAKLHYIHNSPSADLSSSLRLLKHRSVPSVDYDSNRDDFEMFFGDSNENDDSSLSYIDRFNEPLESYPQSSSSPSLEFLPRKLLLLQKQKRSSQLSPKTHFNFNRASNDLAGASHTDNAAVASELNDSIRLSASLKNLIQTNPFARAWLTLLLQKLTQEQPMPSIFKYGRRRK
ncbi:unnamed protein product [Rotaria socialis]|uniref:Uncharacterized protein n=1 Tax=Rotaria socialis TaxID=392032 RepID=A0A818FXI1_9BILA|nr:unnamed protein product [Rotaria socialis]CAF3383027.1 unnamed protein product [Rotaria socialis]CAF3427812.1 unnamed protein product [Rotaria socialis]CAF3471885.1 unnamed protein product [Rotaria socialis]CAF3480891.1 unnamed protein product [Rotaria socialis]